MAPSHSSARFWGLVSESLKIEVPDDLDEDELEDYFHQIKEELYPALDLELEDDRAQVDDVDFEAVVVTDDSVQIEYTVQYSAYYGCKDMDYADDDQRTVFGTRNGRIFEFDKFIPPPRRSTADEL